MFKLIMESTLIKIHYQLSFEGAGAFQSPGEASKWLEERFQIFASGSHYFRKPIQTLESCKIHPNLISLKPGHSGPFRIDLI